MMGGDMAFGIREGDRPGAARIGRAVEDLGYRELWTGDSGGYGGIATLADTTRGTSRLGLAVGVIPVHRFGTTEIDAQLARADLPQDRLTIGLGAGRGARLAEMREAVARLRETRPDIDVGLAAVGPRMCELAGEIADVVLLSWCLPDRIRWACERIRDGAAVAGRAAPRIAGYVRIAAGNGAEDRIRSEMGGYGQARHYARSFQEQGGEAIGIALARHDADELAERLRPYRELLDTVVIRGLTEHDETDELLEFVELAAPRRRQD